VKMRVLSFAAKCVVGDEDEDNNNASCVVDIPATVALALRLQNAGASVLCIHGRTCSQRDHQGAANWEAIRAVKRAVRVPVIANGSMQNRKETEECLQYTKADAVMCGTGLLRVPSMFVNYSSGSATTTSSASTTSTSSTSSSGDTTAIVINSRSRSSTSIRINIRSAEAAIRDSRRYVTIAQSLWHSTPGLLAVSGSNTSKVIRDHLLAILQRYIMDIHIDLWSLLGSNGIRQPEQFLAFIDAVSVRLGLEEGRGGGGAEAGPEVIAEVPTGVPVPPLRPPLRQVVRLYSLKEIKLGLFETVPVPIPVPVPVSTVCSAKF
jgi:hypothetical protein